MATIEASVEMFVSIQGTQSMVQPVLVEEASLIRTLSSNLYLIMDVDAVQLSVVPAVTGIENWGRYFPIADYEPAFYDENSYYDKSEYSDEEE